MKIHIAHLAPILIFLCSALSTVFTPALAQVSLVASTTAGLGSNGGTTSSINTTGANLIVVSINSSAANLATLSDNKSNVWTTGTPPAGSNSGITLTTYYCLNPTTGTAQTFSLSGTSSFSSLEVMAFSGASQMYGISGVGVASNTSTTSLTLPAISTSTSGCVFIASTICSTAGGLSISPSGFTAISVAVGSNYFGGMAYLIQAGSGSQNPKWTIPSTNAAAAVMYCFGPATVTNSGGGGPTVITTLGPTVTAGTLTLTGGTIDMTGTVNTSCSATLTTTSTASPGYWTQNLNPYEMLSIAGSYGIAGGSLGTVALTSGSGALGQTGTSATTHAFSGGSLYFSGPNLATQTGTLTGGTWSEATGTIAAGQSVVAGLYVGSTPSLASAALQASSGTFQASQNSNKAFSISGSVSAGSYYWLVLRSSSNFSNAPLYELAESGGSFGTVSTGSTYPALDASFTGTTALIGSNVSAAVQINYVTATDPGASNVLSPTAYAINGLSETGGLTLPLAGDVLGKSGSYGVSGSGSLGTLTLPSGSNVLALAGSYGISGSGSLGTLTLPAITVGGTTITPTSLTLTGGTGDLSGSITGSCSGTLTSSGTTSGGYYTAQLSSGNVSYGVKYGLSGGTTGTAPVPGPMRAAAPHTGDPANNDHHRTKVTVTVEQK